MEIGLVGYKKMSTYIQIYIHTFLHAFIPFFTKHNMHSDWMDCELLSDEKDLKQLPMQSFIIVIIK